MPLDRLTLLDSSGNDHEKPHRQRVFIVEEEFGRFTEDSAEGFCKRPEAKSAVSRNSGAAPRVIYNHVEYRGSSEWWQLGHTWRLGPAQVPGSSDTAVINLSGGVVSTGSNDSALSLMTNSSTTVSVSNGSLTLAQLHQPSTVHSP